MEGSEDNSPVLEREPCPQGGGIAREEEAQHCVLKGDPGEDWEMGLDERGWWPPWGDPPH